MTKEFLLSKDQKHRFKLKYSWDANKPAVLFIMLNPSSFRPDNTPGPTSQILIKYAMDNGFGTLYIGNLFSYISPNPYLLLNNKSPVVLEENDICLRQMSIECKEIIFAWGKYDFSKRRAGEIQRMFPEGKILYKNQDGTPAHPLSPNFKHKIIL